jgi:hypothetical protein
MPVAAAERSERAEFQEDGSMSAKSERRKKRYAEDPVFRERELATNRRFRLRHREELNERKRLERISDPEFPARHHERTIRIKYGLPLGEYGRMLAAQNGVCKICQRTCYRRLSVDHCHITKKVRWLCAANAMSGSGNTTMTRTFCGRRRTVSTSGSAFWCPATAIPCLRRWR